MQARLADPGQARATLAALDSRHDASPDIRNAAAVIRLAEHDPAAARRELQSVFNRTASVLPNLTLVEAHLLDALPCSDLGDHGAARQALEQALNLAEPDRLILPFAMTGAWKLLETLPRQGTSHAALVADILDAVRDGAPATANTRATATSRATATTPAPALAKHSAPANFACCATSPPTSPGPRSPASLQSR